MPTPRHKLIPISKHRRRKSTRSGTPYPSPSLSPSPPHSPLIPEPVNSLERRHADVSYLHSVFYAVGHSETEAAACIQPDLEKFPLQLHGAPEEDETDEERMDRFFQTVERRMYRGVPGREIRRLIGRMLDVKGNRVVWWLEWAPSLAQPESNPFRYGIVSDEWLKSYGVYRQLMIDFLTRATDDAIPFLSGDLREQLQKIRASSPISLPSEAPSPPSPTPPPPPSRVEELDELDVPAVPLNLIEDPVEAAATAVSVWPSSPPRPASPAQETDAGDAPEEVLRDNNFVPEPSALDTWRQLQTAPGLLEDYYRDHPEQTVDLWFAAASVPLPT
ncbi:uncharacterized protein LOC129597426 [Paramacrobiotus metropolitanus]|uniref:uncharacterized protein LOC129597426 n=1 Tax=Paramacrobiotus metropolitanus TaxID=2943436 RepID=UPI0024462A58|nr:uncharacterized protein LOC129597426 [Paramacrobiotus metropolitanus]